MITLICNIILGLLLCFICGGMLYTVILFLREHRLFEYRNNRRYCRRCGQQQSLYARPWAGSPTWWENTGELKLESCECHRYSKYIH